MTERVIPAAIGVRAVELASLVGGELGAEPTFFVEGTRHSDREAQSRE